MIEFRAHIYGKSRIFGGGVYFRCRSNKQTPQISAIFLFGQIEHTSPQFCDKFRVPVFQIIIKLSLQKKIHSNARSCLPPSPTFGRFQTYLGATTRCLLFAGTGGGIYPVGQTPPVFALFCFICFVFLSRSPTVVSDQGIVHNCFLGPPRLRGTFPCGDRVVLHSFLRG